MKRIFVFLFGFLAVFASHAQITVVTPPGHYCVIQWVNNQCPPLYGNVVAYGTGPGQSLTPPCPESILIVDDQTEGHVWNCPTPTGGWNSGNSQGTFSTPSSVTDGGGATFTPGPTVQNGVQQIQNNGSTGQVYMQTRNGQPTGNFVYVPPGGTGTITESGQAGDQWGAVPVNPGPGDINGGTQTQNPDGTINLNGATVGAALGGQASGTPFQFGNSDTPLLTNGQTMGTPGATNYPTPTNAPAQTGNATGTPQTNGPVNLAPGTSSGSNLNNGTFSSGINVLYAQNQADESAIVDAIHQLDAHNQNGFGGVSNAITTGNNTLSGMSNLLSGIYSNTLPNTNTPPTNVDNSAQASAAALALTNAWNGSTGGVPGQPAVDGGSDDGMSIAIAGIGTLTVGMNGLSSYWNPVRECIAWTVVLSLFFAMMRYAEQALLGVLNQRQVQGSTEEVAGTNASAAVGIGYAAAISAFIVTVPTAFTAYFTTTHALIGSFAGGVSALGSSPAWHLVCLAMPMDVWISAFWSYATFRYILGIPLTMGIRVLILWFIN